MTTGNKWKKEARELQEPPAPDLNALGRTGDEPMSNDKRTKRERLLSTLPREQLDKIAPLSEGTIRQAIAQGVDEAAPAGRTPSAYGA